MHDRATKDHGQRSVPTFVRMVILEVISDPTTIDTVKLSHFQHDLQISNPAYASVAPRNSIIARPVMQKGAGASDKVMCLYPFFPPHLQFPAKAGEHVWAIFEQPDAKISEIGYWMCRIVGPSFVEDVNYTHMDRQFDATFLPGLSSIFEGTDSPIYELRNGAVDTKGSQRFTIPETSSIPGDETAYETLVTPIASGVGTEAAAITQFEPVPRYRKRPADTVFEGSNNTLIVLGTDRTGPYADTTKTDPTTGTVPAPVKTDVFAVGAGAIDMVVGRGQTPATAGKPEATNTIAGPPTGTKELGKSHKDLAPTEGDVDLINDRSRILNAQMTVADTNFAITNIVQAHTSTAPIKDPTAPNTGYGAIVIKTDKIRLIARQDVVLLVTEATATDANGNVEDPGTAAAVVDPTKCASIIIRVNGDIIFTPSATGVVRLGGDDAALSPLCSMVGPTAGMAGPIPPPSPIVDTMGGAQGGLQGLNGTFPTKVLMK